MSDERERDESSRELDEAQTAYLKAKTQLTKLRTARFLFMAVLILVALLVSFVNIWFSL